MSEWIEKPEVPKTKSKPTFGRMSSPASMGYRRPVKVMKVPDKPIEENDATENL